MEDQPTITSRLLALKREGEFDIDVEAIPYANFIGIGLKWDGSELLTRMRYGEHLIGNPILPALHGGTLGSLVEFAAMFGLVWESEAEALPKIVNITIEYLRPARPEDMFARAVVNRLGRRVANVYVTAWQQDRNRPAVAGIANFLLA